MFIDTPVTVTQVQLALEIMIEVREETDLTHSVKLVGESDGWNWTSNRC